MNEKIRKTPAFAFLRTNDKNFIRLLYVLVAVFLLCAIVKPATFLQASNFQSMASVFPEFGILSLGISLSLITAGMDLSVVFIANLSAILSAKFMMAFAPDDSSPHTLLIILAAMVLSILIGVLCGLFNGFLIAKIKIPAMLATIGTQQVFWGLAIVITGGSSLSGMPEMYSDIMNATLFNFLPVSLLVFILCAAVLSIFLSKTRYGSEIYLLGTNAKASKYAGINNDRLILLTYVISGIFSALAGLVMMAGSNSCRADYGESYTMQCILIAVMGGVNPNGGFGNVKGVVTAIVILQFLSSTLNMFENVSNFYRDVIWGAALIIVMIVNYMINQRQENELKGR